MKLYVRILIFTLMLCMLSVSVFAANKKADDTTAEQTSATEDSAKIPVDTSKDEDTEELVDSEKASEGSGSTAASEEKKPEDTESKAPAEENKAESVVVSSSDMTRENCLILSKKSLKKAIDELQKTNEYPLVVDLTAYEAEVDFIYIPEDFITAIAGQATEENNTDDADTTEAETAEETAEETEKTKAKAGKTAKDDGEENEETADTAEIEEPDKAPVENIPAVDPKEVVLKVILKSGEYSWNRKALKESAVANGMVKVSVASATEKKENPVVDEVSGDSVKIEAKEKDNYGILFVAKDKSDNWSVTGSNLFASKAIYVVAIVILVLLTFAVILAVNLLIIKIYKMKK